jgi:hypothetical protein
MNEARLRSLLREAPILVGEDAERRGLAVASEAFAERRRAPRPALPRLAVAFAVATLLAGLMLTSAGAAVRDWIGDVFAAGVPDAETHLTEIPGGGRLLVRSAAGPWIVQPDGSRRLLGDYDEATWSPRGLFVASASGGTLSAVEPGGTPRWSLPAPGRVVDPRWSPSGFQIAYRAGPELRVVAGDGTEDALLSQRAKPLPPAWSPQGLGLLAYVDAAGSLRVANTDSGETVGSAAALDGIAALEWAEDGATLLEASRQALQLRPVALRKALSSLALGPPQWVPLPVTATVQAAAFSPDGATIAVLLRRPAAAAPGPRSEVLLVDATKPPEDGSTHRLFAVTGRLTGLAWSPNGSRLLLSWPDADQWLFVPADGRGRIRAIGGISAEFAPGGSTVAFPTIDGWCCRASVAGPAG